MNPTPSVSSTLPAKKTMTAFALSHTHKPMSSSSASASPHPPRLRTSERNGSLKSTTTALASHA